jgi:hypothetical protein
MRTKKYSEDCPKFFRCQELYNLWLNRDNDKPVTTKELYNVVATIAEAIAEAENRAKSHATWSGWGGY